MMNYVSECLKALYKVVKAGKAAKYILDTLKTLVEWLKLL